MTNETVRQKDEPLANSSKLGLVKGFRDFTGEEAVKRAGAKRIIEEAFERYGFEPAETPVVEYEDFVRGENKEDEAVSDIFKLQDKGKRNLSLRYEFTFQLKRLMKNRKLPYKRYQIGPVFRDEPISQNRFRQFTQCDVDVIGSAVRDEAEVLALAYEISTKLGIKPIILINNRQLLNEILEDNKVKEKDKIGVLKEIDKMGKIDESQIKSNLKKYNAEKVLNALKKGEAYFSKFESYKDILELMKYCRIYGVKVLFSPTVIRGLSYYNGSVFEIKSDGVRETIIAGGSYKFEGVQCTGISFGLDRISALSKLEDSREKALVVSLEQDKEAVKLAQKLREKKGIVLLYYGKPSKAMEYANSYNIGKVIFVGKDEVKSGKYKVKDMKTGKETEGKL